MKLTIDEKCDIRTALSMWANYIETSNVVLSEQDALQQGCKGINNLDEDQRKKVACLRKLGNRLYRSIYGPDDTNEDTID
jgi:hypothetical protein